MASAQWGTTPLGAADTLIADGSAAGAFSRAVGVLGGMGPEASSRLYEYMIALAVEQYGAKAGKDFPEIVLCSIPVPDFISDLTQRQRALELLTARVRALGILRLRCLGIACNTIHLLLPQLEEASSIPFVSMIEGVAQTVQQSGARQVGVLGTPSTMRSGMYQVALFARGIGALTPPEDAYPCVEECIRAVIAGRAGSSAAQRLMPVADELVARGAEGIVLGCTELPLIFPDSYVVPSYDSLKILAEALVTEYYRVSW